jgi:replication-associated recombination protein RarA
VTRARIQTPGVLDEAEDDLDRSLRPRRLEEFGGQDGVREQLAVSLEAAVALGEPLDHVLLSGPPGLGKTSLALIIGSELGTAVKITSGPAIERSGDLAAMLQIMREVHSGHCATTQLPLDGVTPTKVELQTVQRGRHEVCTEIGDAEKRLLALLASSTIHPQHSVRCRAS